METPERAENDKGDLRKKLEVAIEKAKDVCERLEERTASAAKGADKVVRENPYQAVGIAFGVGLLVGLLVSRRRRD